MIKRILLSILVGIITFLAVLLIGALISIFPVVGGIGALIQSLAWLFGLVAGVWFFLTGERLWS